MVFWMQLKKSWLKVVRRIRWSFAYYHMARRVSKNNTFLQSERHLLILILGVIYCSNSVPVKIKKIQDLIVSRELLNKPKILILQSCQGEETQRAEIIENNFTDSNYLAHDGVPVKTVPMRCDFLVAKSTIPGFSSIRHIKEGSWFIQTLCKIIESESQRYEMLGLILFKGNLVSFS